MERSVWGAAARAMRAQPSVGGEDADPEDCGQHLSGAPGAGQPGRPG